MDIPLGLTFSLVPWLCLPPRETSACWFVPVCLVHNVSRDIFGACVFALFIAAASIFLARQQVFPALLRKTGVLVLLSVLPLLLMIFWLIRVRFADVYKKRVTSSLNERRSANSFA